MGTAATNTHALNARQQSWPSCVHSILPGVFGDWAGVQIRLATCEGARATAR